MHEERTRLIERVFYRSHSSRGRSRRHRQLSHSWDGKKLGTPQGFFQRAELSLRDLASPISLSDFATDTPVDPDKRGFHSCPGHNWSTRSAVLERTTTLALLQLEICCSSSVSHEMVEVEVPRHGLLWAQASHDLSVRDQRLTSVLSTSRRL